MLGVKGKPKRLSRLIGRSFAALRHGRPPPGAVDLGDPEAVRRLVAEGDPAAMTPTSSGVVRFPGECVIEVEARAQRTYATVLRVEAEPTDSGARDTVLFAVVANGAPAPMPNFERVDGAVRFQVERSTGEGTLITPPAPAVVTLPLSGYAPWRVNMHNLADTLALYGRRQAEGYGYPAADYLAERARVLADKPDPGSGEPVFSSLRSDLPAPLRSNQST